MKKSNKQIINTGNKKTCDNGSKYITALLIEPRKKPQLIELKNCYEERKKIVGGWLCCTLPYEFLEDEVEFILNDNGKIDGLPKNRSLRYECGTAYDVIAGTFLICGTAYNEGKDGFVSLSPHLIDKYMKRFAEPEYFNNNKYDLTMRVITFDELPFMTPRKR
jgi:hypothetical protein